MKPVWYLECCRKKRNVCKQVIYPIVLVMVLFLVCLLVDRVMPKFNITYMRWPDMVKDFLCLPGWSNRLWFNVWQLFALGYPFYVYYVTMVGLTDSIVAEVRLETSRYVQNAGIGKYAFLMGKYAFWLFALMLNVATQAVLNGLLILVMGETNELQNRLSYYGIVFVIGVFYLTIALLIAVGSHTEQQGSRVIAQILIVPWLISRVYGVVQFFVALLIQTGREGAVVEKLALVAQRLQALQIVSPLTWCWPRMDVTAIEWVSAVVICILLFGMSFFVWSGRKVLR